MSFEEGRRQWPDREMLVHLTPGFPLDGGILPSVDANPVRLVRTANVTQGFTGDFVEANPYIAVAVGTEEIGIVIQ